MFVKDSLIEIKELIKMACNRVNRDASEVKIIAVTKYVSVERTKEALAAGISHLGENRDDTFLHKWTEIGQEANWHFIGSLQTRKVKNIIDKVQYIHSLDRLSLAEELQKRATKKVKCFIQVNVSGEESKHGISPEELTLFVEKLGVYSSIEIVGLMTMAPFTENRDLIRTCFRTLRMLRDKIQTLQLPYAPCKELSMGMSNDFEIAVEEGATFIRLGTSLVGNE